MKTLYLDCSMGAAGDMLAGALLELTGNPGAAIAELNMLGIPGVTYHCETLFKCGLAATHLKVLVEGHEEHEHHHHHHEHHHHEHRSLNDVLNIIGQLMLEPTVREDVQAVYRLLAQAESRAHGREVG